MLNIHSRCFVLTIYMKYLLTCEKWLINYHLDDSLASSMRWRYPSVHVFCKARLVKWQSNSCLYSLRIINSANCIRRFAFDCKFPLSRPRTSPLTFTSILIPDKHGVRFEKKEALFRELASYLFPGLLFPVEYQAYPATNYEPRILVIFGETKSQQSQIWHIRWKTVGPNLVCRSAFLAQNSGLHFWNCSFMLYIPM